MGGSVMNKRLAALCAVALLGVGMAGCGKPADQTETVPLQTPAPTEWTVSVEPDVKKYQGVELSFLSCWEENDPEAAVVTQAAELFYATTGARVEIRWMPEYYQDGDIFQMPGVVLGNNYQDKVLDLTEMARAAGYEEKSLECLREQVISRSGTLNAIPQTPYVSGIYYNTEILDECGLSQMPRTYEELLKLCRTLQERGYSPMTMNTDMADDQLMLHLTQYLGTAAGTDVAKKGGWADTAAGAVEDIWDFVGSGYLAYTAPATYPGGQDRMGLSNCALIYGTNALCAQVEEETFTGLSWGMFPYPGVAGGEPVISVDADVLAISADCEAPQAAFDFILLLTTGELDQLRADITNGIPADPGNTSPVRGALEALHVTQVLPQNQVEFTEKQETSILKLWQGKYKEAADFLREMDGSYDS